LLALPPQQSVRITAVRTTPNLPTFGSDPAGAWGAPHAPPAPPGLPAPHPWDVAYLSPLPPQSPAGSVLSTPRAMHAPPPRASPQPFRSQALSLSLAPPRPPAAHPAPQLPAPPGSPAASARGPRSPASVASQGGGQGAEACCLNPAGGSDAGAASPPPRPGPGRLRLGPAGVASLPAAARPTGAAAGAAAAPAPRGGTPDSVNAEVLLPSGPPPRRVEDIVRQLETLVAAAKADAARGGGEYGRGRLAAELASLTRALAPGGGGGGGGGGGSVRFGGVEVCSTPPKARIAAAVAGAPPPGSPGRASKGAASPRGSGPGAPPRARGSREGLRHWLRERWPWAAPGAACWRPAAEHE
jgi:translation initiation factor IF-2